MRIINSTSWPDWFLRKMSSWCFRELEMSPKDLYSIVFRNSRSTWGGCAHGSRGSITVCITKEESQFPCSTKCHEGSLQEHVADRLEALIMVTAHELAHIRNWRCGTRRSGNPGGGEGHTDSLAFYVLRQFRLLRETLLVQWSDQPAIAMSSPIPLTEKREKKARADLERWQRKLKLAQTKVRKLKTRVRYYESKSAQNPKE